MTQIYVNRSSAGKNRMIVPAILFLIVATLCFGLWLHSKKQPDASKSQDTAGTPTFPSVLPTSEAPAILPENLPGISVINEKITASELQTARDMLFSRLAGLKKPSEIMETEKILGDLNIRMVFSRAPMQEKASYVIKAGDTLGELAKQYGTTKELISEINDIENNIIRVGKSLQILTGTFTAVVDKSSNDMMLQLNDRFFKRYVVGTGTDSSTPVGDYKITVRLRHPVWYRPDGKAFPYGHPGNLLGTHYLKLNTPGIGLHGTWDPGSVGSQSSAGCVRFKNEMIEELYKILPEGTSVKIVD